MQFRTADLCDEYPDAFQILELPMRDLGGRAAFHGAIRTVRAPEDNSMVRKALESDGQGMVLVVDGGGSLRRALLGDQLADLAVRNGWEGIVLNGCIRDAAQLRQMTLGVRALGTCPLKTVKRNEGAIDEPVRFGGVLFVPGHQLYADEDGIVITEKPSGARR
ncbi:MAG: ribonuclease E activity regulator RraA [Myxococcales bacterium]